MIVANTSQESALTLDSKELYYLADLLGADCLDCMENPFRGYLQNEATENRDDVRESLIAKGVINRAVGDIAIPQEMFSRLAA